MRVPFLVLLLACRLPEVPDLDYGDPCNLIDDDGDGEVDEGWDRDGDGVSVCHRDPSRRDCDDLDPDIRPGAPERCNGVDDDCDGTIPVEERDLDGDDDLACDGDCDDARAILNSLDHDADGVTSCGGDCDDRRADAFPGAPELCNGADDDCDGALSLDEQDLDADGLTTCEGDCGARDPLVGPRDLDGDGYSACGEHPDCDDIDPTTYPGAVESCNGRDDDCDGVVDGPSAVDASVFYEDHDGDGAGGPTQLRACSAPAGFAPRSDDCDDAAPRVHPAASEVCNQIDDDCDGVVDDGLPLLQWYADADADGFGRQSSGYFRCGPITGDVGIGGDCDDTSAEVHPGAVEVCDGRDEDCDQVADNAAIDAISWFLDRDGDGYGDAYNRVDSCSEVPGRTTRGGDCDDFDPTVSPGSPEICGDDIDQNCTGTDEICPAVCGDGECQAPEDSLTCCQDCGDSIPLGMVNEDARCGTVTWGVACHICVDAGFCSETPVVEVGSSQTVDLPYGSCIALSSVQEDGTCMEFDPNAPRQVRTYCFGPPGICGSIPNCSEGDVCEVTYFVDAALCWTAP